MRNDGTNTTTRVQLRLLWHRDTSDQAIRVSTSDGNVRLHGRADSERAQNLAAQIAEQTDEVVAARLRETLRFDRRTAAAGIDTPARAGREHCARTRRSQRYRQPTEGWIPELMQSADRHARSG
nr:BON domain-containing protein [Rhabdochromatium marinum]